MTLGTLKTIGYTEKAAVQRIEAFLTRPRSGLIDIRKDAYCSWSTQWNRDALKQKYGNQYIHLPCFGNVNHGQPGKPISLVHPGERLDEVVNALMRGSSLLLLCACKDYEKCHRKTVYDLIVHEVRRKLVQQQSEVQA